MLARIPRATTKAAKKAAQVAKKAAHQPRRPKKANTPQDVALPAPKRTPADDLKLVNLTSLRMAIEDLIATFGKRYPQGAQYLEQLATLEREKHEIEAALDRRATSRQATGKTGKVVRAPRRNSRPSSRPIAVCSKRHCSPTPCSISTACCW